MHTHTTSIDNVVISKIRDISRGHNSHVLSSIAIIKEGFISVCLDGGSGKEDYQESNYCPHVVVRLRDSANTVSKVLGGYIIYAD